VDSLTGTAALVRLALRRDRILLPACVAAFVIMVTFSASATVALYPTVESRIQAAASINSMTSLVALYGRIYDETSLGAVAMIKMGGLGAAMVAVLALFTIVRHTRSEEETGRLELLGAGVVGRRAPLTAALVVAVGTSLMLGALTAAALIAIELPVAGSIAFGLSWASIGVAFAAVASVTAQLTRSARTASGIAVATLGVVYVLRAIGDTSLGVAAWLTWLSPIGWGQQLRPFAGERWWVLALPLIFTAAVIALGYALAARRDLGAGLLPDRPGPAAAGARLASPLGLAWRLQRGVLLAWSAAFALLGAVFGGIAANVGDIFTSPESRALIEALGGKAGITDAFISAELGFLGIFAAAYGVQASLRLHSEEEALRAEPVLAAAVTRLRWAGSHIGIAVAGTAWLLVLSGLTAGAALAVQSNDAANVSRVLTGAVVQLPAACVITGVVVILFGLVPRAASWAWAVLIACVLAGELGALLELPSFVLDLSPFAHVPRVPAAEITAAPLLGLGAVAVTLVAAGLVGFRRRDVG